jgi:hypothetical protein
MPLGDISVGLIRKWVSDLDASGLAPATVVKAGQILSKVLRSAVEEGIISTNPTSTVRLSEGLERHEMRTSPRLRCPAWPKPSMPAAEP